MTDKRVGFFRHNIETYGEDCEVTDPQKNRLSSSYTIVVSKFKTVTVKSLVHKLMGFFFLHILAVPELMAVSVGIFYSV